MFSSASALGLPMPEGKGDLNGDGKSNYYDWILVRNAILGMSPITENAFEQADVNDDGKVNQIDLNYFNSLAPVPSVWGDINNDGIFNSVDLAYFRSYLLGIEIPYEPVYRKEYIWDVNCDGKIDSIDFANLRGYLLGTIDKLPVQNYVVIPEDPVIH